MEAVARKELLEIARNALIACTSNERRELGNTRNKFPSNCGAFVTLHGSDHSLRGCIGCLTADHALPEVVVEMVQSAALRDPRFTPVTAEEVAGLSIEISVLTPTESITALDQVVIGRDGLLVVSQGSRGVLLPQVASERGWDTKTFAEQTCLKACLDRNAYLQEGVQLYKFSAEVFNEYSL